LPEDLRQSTRRGLAELQEWFQNQKSPG